MNILLVLIPVTLLVIGIAVTLFFWAVNHQQFDDLDSPGVLPLMDDPAPAQAFAQCGPLPGGPHPPCGHLPPHAGEGLDCAAPPASLPPQAGEAVRQD